MYKINSGFTLIELLVSISIFLMIALLALPSYHAIRNNIALKNDSLEIVNMLRKAQSRSISSLDGVRHGVHFDSDKYTIYEGEWASPLKTAEYKLKNGISVLSGGNSEVEFSRLTGKTDDKTIVIGASSSDTKTIHIEKNGNISIKN